MQESNELQNSVEHPLGTEKIGKLLLKFAIPCVLSLLVSALYNIVDQIFIGQGVGFLGNAATNVVYPVTVIALAFALLVGDGGASLLSLSLGSKDEETSHKVVGNSIILITIIGFAMVAIGYLFQEQILNIFGVTPSCYDYAKDYLQWILPGVPFFMFGTGMNSIIRADGNPKYSMISMLCGALINIILDPIAIFVLGWGVKGAAIATILGQVVSCIVTLCYFRKPKSFKFHKSSFKFNGRIIGKITSFGISSFITQLSIVALIAVMNNALVTHGAMSKYGADIPLSALGIVMKVYGIVVSIVIGIAVGGQPIIGFNYGAKNHNRVLKTYRLLSIAAATVGIIAFAIFQLRPQSIINLFGSEDELYNEFAQLCFQIYLAGIILGTIQKSSGIFLQSIGRPFKSMALSLSRDIVFLIPLILILPKHYGMFGILWAAPIADVVAIILTIVLVTIEYRKIRAMSIVNEVA